MRKINVAIKDPKTGRMKTMEVEAFVEYTLILPSGRGELFAITHALGPSEKPYVITHVATGLKCGDAIGVCTKEAMQSVLIKTLHQVRESGIIRAIENAPAIVNVVDDADML